MTGMLAGPDAGVACVLCVAFTAFFSRASGAPGALGAEGAERTDAVAALRAGWDAYVLLALACLALNFAAIAAEELWQRTVERSWNEACLAAREKKSELEAKRELEVERQDAQEAAVAE